MPLILWRMYCSGLSALTSRLVVRNTAAACSCQGPGSLLPRDPLLLLRLPGLCGCVGGDKGRPAGGHSEQQKGPPPRDPAGRGWGEEWGGRSAREGYLCRGDQADPTCPCLSNQWLAISWQPGKAWDVPQMAPLFHTLVASSKAAISPLIFGWDGPD